jgi:DNA-binding LacI/PurR family transcriptional regulator
MLIRRCRLMRLTVAGRGDEGRNAVPGRQRRVTSAQVAERSGVSRATVSYVLNKTPNQSIPEGTRRRVMAAVEELGYTPYAPARALRSGRSDVVLFLIPEWPIGSAIARLVEDLTLALAVRGLTLVVHAHPRSARPVTDLWKAVTPAAVINDQVLDDDEVRAVRRGDIPVVTPRFRFDGAETGGEGTFAAFQRWIGRVQAEHLVATGHDRLGYVLPDDDRLSAFAAPRLEGVRRVCAELGLAEPVTRTVALDVASAARAVRQSHGATGICAYNDEVALAVLAGMRAGRLTAPDDIAVVGVDDIPAAALTSPALTTVAIGMSTLGRYLATAVAHALEGKPAPPGPGPGVVRLIRRETT